MINAIILTAGKQTRFKSHIPKALYPYKDSTILEHNINELKQYVDKIFVVTSFDNKQYFENLKFDDMVEVFSIHSGFGCGDAVYKSLYEIKKIKSSDDVVLIWGDSIQNRSVIKELIKNYNDRFVIPVVKEESPYVEFVVSNKIVKHVSFSKYKEKINKNSYHDLSIFMFKKIVALNALTELVDKTFDDGKYQYRNNEMLFLDIFNFVDENNPNAEILELDKIIDKSFNTLEEYSKLS